MAGEEAGKEEGKEASKKESKEKGKKEGKEADKGAVMARAGEEAEGTRGGGGNSMEEEEAEAAKEVTELGSLQATGTEKATAGHCKDFLTLAVALITAPLQMTFDNGEQLQTLGMKYMYHTILQMQVLD